MAEKQKRESKVLVATHYLGFQFKHHLIAALTAAFAFLMALVWRDAIQEGISTLINKIDFLKIQNTYLYKIYTATIITLICIGALIIFSKWTAKKP